MRLPLLASLLTVFPLASICAQRTTSAPGRKLTARVIEPQVAMMVISGDSSRPRLDTVAAVTVAGPSSAQFATLDVELLGKLLNTLPLTGDVRDRIVKEMVALFQQGVVAPTDVTRILKESGLADASVGVVSKLLLTPTSDNDFNAFSALTATGTTDRLYSSVDLANFAMPLGPGQLEIRLVTGIGVSNADSAASPSSAASQPGFQERTASIMSALHEGGPAALHFGYRFNNNQQFAKVGYEFAMAGSVATGGKQPLASSASARVGIAGEGKLLLNDGSASNSKSVMFVLRGGTRIADETIIEGVSERKLYFGQLSVEFRALALATPIGVAFTKVNSPFSPYVRTIQFFGIAGL